jgi:3alpha(or 20beta)-hydroxysteroid dehydrogenase
MRLDGRVALVTGAARGMGAADVRRLHSEGATVVAADVLDDELKVLVEEFPDRVHAAHLDVTSEVEWTSVMEQIEREHGRLDVLVNNAGILRFNTIEQTPIEELRLVLDVNLVGTFLGMKHAIPVMRRSGGGSIINLSSTEGLGGSLATGAYCASKFAVRGITKVAAMENGQHGIRVNSIHPGGIDTPMTHDVMGDSGRSYIAKKVAIGRMGEAEDIANLVAFLASDESSYCTGAEFVIDGGASATAGF